VSKLLTVCLVAVSLGAVFSGCASSRSTAIHAFEQKLNGYKALCFTTVPMTAEDIEKERRDLEDQVLKLVEKQRIFGWTQIGSCDTSGTLNVQALITDIRKVSGTARFFIGAFAGEASLTSDVVFLDGATGDTLGVYTVTGKSGGSGMSGGTESAVKQTAKAISKLIKANYN